LINPPSALSIAFCSSSSARLMVARCRSFPTSTFTVSALAGPTMVIGNVT
jgi:hypothetical protein